jgi:hypothetical protein
VPCWLSTARVAKTWGVAILAYGFGLESKVSRRVSGYPRTLRNAFLVATLSPTNRKRSQPGCVHLLTAGVGYYEVPFEGTDVTPDDHF